MMDWIFDRYSAISYSLLIALTAGALFLIGAASVFGTGHCAHFFQHLSLRCLRAPVGTKSFVDIMGPRGTGAGRLNSLRMPPWSSSTTV